MSQKMSLNDLRKVKKFLKSKGLREIIDFKITVFKNGLVDIFIGDVKAEYGDDRFDN